MASINDLLFGWMSVGSKQDKTPSELKSVSRDEGDGSIVVTHDGGNEVVGDSCGWSVSLDIDPLIVSEQTLITKYREMALVPEIDKAIEIIINEMVSTDADEIVSVDLDRVEYSDELKKKISEEFNHVIKVMDFNRSSYEILRRWYIDGRLQYQVVVDPQKYQTDGIGKLTYLDPRKLKKIKVVQRQKDQRTSVDTYSDKATHYIYSDQGFLNTNNTSGMDLSMQGNAVKISEEAVVQVTSGLLDPSNSVILSYLHKAIRPLNQLKSLEDATMIYKISRAPERRIFYIDVGNLPPGKAEQVLQRQMNQFRSKMVYDINTGTVRSDSKQMTMTEDYWLPRRSDGRATEITTLPSGQLSGELGELTYFQNKLYNSLNVPITRMDPTSGFSFGRTTEITRDEVILTKFVSRLRRRFSNIFLDLLKRQLTLKNILNPHEFENIRHLINFKFESDNHFDEMLANEVFENRLNMLDRMVNYMAGGQYPTFFSMDYAYKEILHMTDEEIELEKERIEEDQELIKDQSGSEDSTFEGPNVTHVAHSSDPSKNIAKSRQTPEPINNNNTDTQEVTQQ